MASKKEKPTLVVDFDGTLVKEAWPKIGRWNPGAVEAMKELAKDFRIVIHSCRVAPVLLDGRTRRNPGELASEVQKMRTFLDKAGLTMIDIHTKGWKPRGIAYIDDRAIHYNGRNGAWKAISTRVRASHFGVVPGGEGDNE